MKVKNHVITSGVVSSVIYAVTKSPAAAIGSFLAGALLDADHFIDYYLNYGFSINLKAMHDAMNEYRLPKIYILLHSFELLSVFWALVFLIPLSMFYFAVALGLTQHIILDQIANPVMPRAYFLTYRIAHGFKRESILNPSKIRSCQEY
jgi:hypothetical protein